MLKLRQYLCKHDYEYIARNKHISENLWQCKKCKVYYMQHWGLGIGYKSKTKGNATWVYK